MSSCPLMQLCRRVCGCGIQASSQLAPLRSESVDGTPTAATRLLPIILANCPILKTARTLANTLTSVFADGDEDKEVARGPAATAGVALAAHPQPAGRVHARRHPQAAHAKVPPSSQTFLPCAELN